MDKTVVLAVAGSGKTTFIVDDLTLDKRALLITYTDNNLATLRRRIIRKFGHIPENIKLYSYFTFLYSFSFKPFLALDKQPKGINWETPPLWTMKKPRDHRDFYWDSYSRIYHNRISKLLDQENVVRHVVDRLEKYFESVYVDEVQDIAGHDFNFLSSICKAETKLLMVGDFFQHTFDTSRDGNVNKTLHDKYGSYIERLQKAGLQVDRESLKKSYRCSPSVCEFITDSIGIEILSHRSDQTEVQIIESSSPIRSLFADGAVVKLFYDEHYKYPCHSQNWGASKGQDHYEDVCVLLGTKHFRLLQKGSLRELSPRTRNKLYVACSRARRNLFLVPERQVAPLRAH